MEKKKLTWIDKDALVIMGIIYLLLFAFPVAFIIRGLVENDFGAVNIGIISCVIFGVFVLSFSHMLPLKMRGDKMFLARHNFPSLKRKAVPLKEIKSVKYSYPEKWDEKAGTGAALGHRVFGFIRVEDIHGNKYRNIFFKTNVDNFKKHIKTLIDSGLIDASWTRTLSPMLKP